MRKDQEEVLKEAIQTFGTRNQLDMATEECAELIQAINKIKRAGIVSQQITKPNPNMDTKTAMLYNSVCSEVADVKIMLAQLELMLDAETIQLCVDRKIENLKNRLPKK